MNSVVYLFCFFEIAIYNLHRKCIRLDMCNVVRQRLENRCLFQTFMYLNWNLRFHSSLQNWTETWKKKFLKNTKLHFFSMQLFNADAAIFSKKKQIYFLPMTTKKTPQKVLIIGPKLFFHKYSSAVQTSQELSSHIIKYREKAYVLSSVLKGDMKLLPSSPYWREINLHIHFCFRYA